MKAFYTNKPDKFADVGNGSKLYRFNMVEVPAPTEPGEEARTQWQVDEITIWEPLSKEKLVKAVLNEQYGQDHELKLLNEYVSAKEEVITGEEAEAAIAAYKAFAAERKALKANVEYDYEHPVTPPSPTSIYFDKRTQAAKVGDEFELTALFMPEGAYAELNWYTNNDKVQLTKITDIKYKVKALSAGTSQVFAKGIGTVFAALCDVTITD